MHAAAAALKFHSRWGIVNRGTLRTFGQDPVYLSIAFAAVMSVVVYMVFLSVGRNSTRSQFAWLKKT
jgi:hypothetical protein